MSFRAFLRGMGRIWDVASWFEPKVQPLTPQEALVADAKAIAGDWKAVGNDLNIAIRQIRLRDQACNILLELTCGRNIYTLTEEETEAMVYCFGKNWKKDLLFE